jgi:putative ABC transport system substrate-binding protein
MEHGAKNTQKQRDQLMSKIISIALGALLLALSLPVEAQQTKKIPLIGVLSPGSREPDSYLPLLEAFRQGLRDRGYVEGENIQLEYRYAEGKLDRMPAFVTELVRLEPAAIVVTAVPAIRAAKQATQTIPIVIISTVDPVAAGIIDSLARPGGNITGLALLTRDLSAKRLELLIGGGSENIAPSSFLGRGGPWAEDRFSRV